MAVEENWQLCSYMGMLIVADKNTKEPQEGHYGRTRNDQNDETAVYKSNLSFGRHLF